MLNLIRSKCSYHILNQTHPIRVKEVIESLDLSNHLLNNLICVVSVIDLFLFILNLICINPKTDRSDLSLVDLNSLIRDLQVFYLLNLLKVVSASTNCSDLILVNILLV